VIIEASKRYLEYRETCGRDEAREKEGRETV